MPDEIAHGHQRIANPPLGSRQRESAAAAPSSSQAPRPAQESLLLRLPSHPASCPPDRSRTAPAVNRLTGSRSISFGTEVSGQFSKGDNPADTPGISITDFRPYVRFRRRRDGRHHASDGLFSEHQGATRSLLRDLRRAGPHDRPGRPHPRSPRLDALSVSAAMEIFSRDPAKAGDIVILNDPTGAAPICRTSPRFRQSSSPTAATPLYSATRHARPSCRRRRMSPGSMPLSTEIYQEGIIIPPLKLVRAGTVDEDVLAVILANVRTPEERRGDFAAQISAHRVGERRLAELAERYDLETLLEMVAELLAYSARMTGRAPAANSGGRIFVHRLPGRRRSGRGTDPHHRRRVARRRYAPFSISPEPIPQSTETSTPPLPSLCRPSTTSSGAWSASPSRPIPACTTPLRSTCRRARY